MNKPIWRMNITGCKPNDFSGCVLLRSGKVTYNGGNTSYDFYWTLDGSGCDFVAYCTNRVYLK